MQHTDVLDVADIGVEAKNEIQEDVVEIQPGGEEFQ